MSEIQPLIDALINKPDADLRAQGIQPDAWREVLRRETSDAHALVAAILQKRSEMKMGADPSREELQVDLIRWFSASYHHRSQVRKSGGFYSEHLWAAAQASVHHGFTDPRMTGACMAHDAPEDIPEVRDGTLPLFFTKLGHFDERVKQEDAQIRSDVDVVTKPNISDPVELSKTYLKALIESLINDPRPVLVKLFDRLHNMQTLDAKKPDKQRKIAKETLDVFVPLARILGLYELQEQLLRLCLKYLNAGLLTELDGFIETRLKTIEDSEIWRTIRSKLKDAPGFQGVTLEPHKVVSRWDVLPSGMTVDAATFRDFGLYPEDPFVWVACRVDENENLLPAVHHIQSTLPGERWQHNPSYGFNRGYSAKTLGPEYSPFGGRVFFRVNTSYNDARSRRGLFSDGDFKIPEALASGARRVVARSSSEDVRTVVQEELLFPTIRISALVGGEFHFLDVPNPTTARQLFKRIYGQDLEPEKVLLQKDPFANPLRATALPWDLDAPLPNGYTVLF